MQQAETIIITGASSTIAQHCCRIWLEKKKIKTLILIGRNLKKLKTLEQDYRVRQPDCEILLYTLDFSDASAIAQLIQSIEKQCQPDIVLIAQGALIEQKICQQSLLTCHDSLSINALSVVLFLEAFAGLMLKNHHGNLAVISSVAGDRGRQSNYVYGAAKSMINTYAEGLQHRLANSGVQLSLIKPGPTDTAMTQHLKQNGQRLAECTTVASDIVQAIENDLPVCYTPGIWRYIMLIIRLIPRFIFHRLKL